MARKTKLLPFNHRLVLNQWLIEQCGHDPLLTHRAGKPLRPLQALASILQGCHEGLDADNLHHFYKKLNLEWQETASVTRDDLLRYEQNIVSHTRAINEKRTRPIVWKYFQWLSLLFVEIYLDRYFNRRDQLQTDLNGYINRFNLYWADHNYETGIEAYTMEDLNKICLQNATGSGKTLLMHVNFLQFRHYADASRLKDDLARTLLITPNESLSKQHKSEMKESGIQSHRLQTDNEDLFTSHKNDMRIIDFTEITKLDDEDGPALIAVRNLGDKNLLLVDEAHRGLGSGKETGWHRRRGKLVKNGFAFEYSATFREAIIAAKNPEIETAYAKNILFDYSYRYFYDDGYGKDYRIFNLPKAYEDLKAKYLTACLLSFYQQLKLYEDRKAEFTPYNLEKPLWVFVGTSVSKAGNRKDDQNTASDVALVLQFIANFLNDKRTSVSIIKEILEKTAKETGLSDENGNDIFAESFRYIKDLLRQENWQYTELLDDILRKVFLNKSGGQLNVARIKGDDSEIMLRVGQQETPFGLINVGDAASLINHINDEKKNQPDEFSNLNVFDAEFSDTLFDQVKESSSPVTVLLGSKKFVEGWDCWRVSTLGLMRVGKSEGAQIIQLFGRGVRLKGWDWTLKRSRFATPTQRPEHIHYLETLNIFGVQADFMVQFKKFLRDEDLPNNDERSIYEIPLNVTYDFGKKLKVLRPRKKDRDGNEYDFKKDAKVPSFGDIPEKLKEKKVVIDWYSRIQSIESTGRKIESDKKPTQFSKDHLAFLDYTDLFFRLERFKRERTWHNFNIAKMTAEKGEDKIKQILGETSWYEMLIPAGSMNKNNIANIDLWQEMAAELLQKYCDELYNYSKAAFMEPRLELRILDHKDGNIPDETEYKLIVDSNEETLIEDIRNLQKAIEKSKEGMHEERDLKACFFDVHLYEPVISATKNKKIQIVPVSLNESEFQFVEDLREYCLSNSEEELYLLRNESRGKGIGFFEAGGFYPDFLLWKIKNEKQYIAFIDPHGLIHEGPASKKIEFHKTIKNIQQRLSPEEVCLNSFIVTPTDFHKLNWEGDIEKWAEENVFFMNDSKETYIVDIMTRMEL